MSPRLDPRVTPARPDLAAETLRGKVEAPRYVAGQAFRIVAASAPLQRAPEPEAPLDSEALYGETVVVYEQRGDWSWAQLDRDGYVGYLPTAALGPPRPATHKVAALRTHAYPAASIKRPPRLALSLGALVAVDRFDGDFAVTADGLFLFAGHLAPLETHEPDFVAVAERFLEAPYLWGGRTSAGIDCSGLVQTALAAAGIPAPRDSDMQQAALGAPCRRPEALIARRSGVLARPRRNHARRGDAAARQWGSDEGDQRAARRRLRPHRNERRRPDHRRAAA